VGFPCEAALTSGEKNQEEDERKKNRVSDGETTHDAQHMARSERTKLSLRTDPGRGAPQSGYSAGSSEHRNDAGRVDRQVEQAPNQTAGEEKNKVEQPSLKGQAKARDEKRAKGEQGGNVHQKVTDAAMREHVGQKRFETALRKGLSGDCSVQGIARRQLDDEGDDENAAENKSRLFHRHDAKGRL